MSAYAIEYYCGPKRGGWHKGNARFPTADAAAFVMTELYRATVQASATPVKTRVVIA
jgi:hypothetical protein